jgi:hypothetical protein
MNLINLNTLLFVGKWAFIGLIYFALFVVVIAVRREMATHTRNSSTPAFASPGRLKVLKPGSDSHTFPGTLLELRPETRLGAAADNDIILADRFVSGHHARLNWDGAAWWVEDLGSTNGTRVDSQSCPPRVPRPVPAGAMLQIGDMAFEMVV